MAVALDYYAILQVNRNATEEEIRAAYKQRAVALHPDKNTESSATKDFQRLVEAYTVLKDPFQRKLYDAKGKMDADDEYYSDEEYEDDDDEPYYQCNCQHHHHHHSRRPAASFASYFEEMFARHYSQYGYRGFFDDDDVDGDGRPRSFWRKYSGSAKGNSRFAADWSSFPNFPSTTELKAQEVPDRPSKPKTTLAGTKIKLEWAKKTPRKRVEKWHLSYSLDNGPWIEMPFPGEEKTYEFTGVVPGTTYAFKVAASNASGMSEFSDPSTVVVPGGAPKKVEEKPQAPAPKPKAKKKAKKRGGDPDSKRNKLVTELEDAIGERDKARLEKAVTAAKRELEATPATDEGDELASFLHQAQAELRSINREAERTVLIQRLKAAGKSGAEEQYWAAEEKLRELLKKDADDDDVVAAVEAEIDAARQLLEVHLEKQRERAAATEELAAAVEEDDVERLSAAIEEAARLSVPTKEARKRLKALQEAQAEAEAEAEAKAEGETAGGEEEAAEEEVAEEAEAEAEAVTAPTAKPAAAAESQEEEELRLAMELSRKEYAEERARLKRTPLALQKEFDEKKEKDGAKGKRKLKGAAAATGAPAAAAAATATTTSTDPATGALPAANGTRGDPHSNPPCKNLWVGNLSWKVTEDQIRQTFAPFGQIESVKILAGKHCCFVNFTHVDEAMKARAAMFGELLLDRPLHIYFGRDDTPQGKANAKIAIAKAAAAAAAAAAKPAAKAAAKPAAGRVVPTAAKPAPVSAPVATPAPPATAKPPTAAAAVTGATSAQTAPSATAVKPPTAAAAVAGTSTQTAAQKPVAATPAAVPVVAPATASATAKKAAAAAEAAKKVAGPPTIRHKTSAQPAPVAAPAQPAAPLAASVTPSLPTTALSPPPSPTQSVLYAGDAVVRPAKGPAQRQPPISAPVQKAPLVTDLPPPHAVQEFVPHNSKLYSHQHQQPFAMPVYPVAPYAGGGAVPNYAAPYGSAQATLANYAVSHVPMMGGVSTQGYFMMSPSMGYPWPGAPQQPYDAPYVAAAAAEEANQGPEDEDYLMQRFGGWN